MGDGLGIILFFVIGCFIIGVISKVFNLPIDGDDTTNSYQDKEESDESSYDDYSEGVKDGMKHHERGGFNIKRGSSRAYQEGYRKGWGDEDDDDE